jgi:chromosome segregation ATPase
VQKLQEITRKRLDDFKNAKRAGVPSKKGIDFKSSPEDLLKMMEQLKDKVATEQDPEESTRLIARIQALNASYVQIAGAEQGATSAGDAVRATLEEDLKKHADELKVVAGKETELRVQLTELRDQLDLSQPHIDRIKKERETCQDVVRSLRDKITAINEEYQSKFDEYKAQMDAWAAEREEVLKERCCLLL